MPVPSIHAHFNFTNFNAVSTRTRTFSRAPGTETSNLYCYCFWRQKTVVSIDRRRTVRTHLWYVCLTRNSHYDLQSVGGIFLMKKPPIQYNLLFFWIQKKLIYLVLPPSPGRPRLPYSYRTGRTHNDNQLVLSHFFFSVTSKEYYQISKHSEWNIAVLMLWKRSSLLMWSHCEKKIRVSNRAYALHESIKTSHKSNVRRCWRFARVQRISHILPNARRFARSTQRFDRKQSGIILFRNPGNFTFKSTTTE